MRHYFRPPILEVLGRFLLAAAIGFVSGSLNESLPPEPVFLNAGFLAAGGGSSSLKLDLPPEGFFLCAIIVVLTY